MGKSNRTPAAPTSQTVVQTNLPDYAQPYFDRLMQRTESATNAPYELYGGPRIAGFSPDQQAAFQQIRSASQASIPSGLMAQGLAGYAAGNLMGMPGYQAGQSNINTMGSGFVAPQIGFQQAQAQNIAGMAPQIGFQGVSAGQVQAPQVGRVGFDFNPNIMNPMDFARPSLSPDMVSSGQVFAPQLSRIQMGFTPSIRDPLSAQTPQISAQEVRANDVVAGQMGAPDVFGQSQADQYMSPFITRVLDAQRQRAQQQFDEQTLQRQGEKARAGVFGGYRQGVEQAQAQRGFNEQVQQMEANALQAAFENAQQQFERDRAAGLNVGQFNIERNLQGQLANQGAGLQALLANQQAGIDVGRTNLDAAMQQMGLGLQRDTSLSNLGSQLAQSQAQMDQQVQELGARLGVDVGQFNVRQALESALANQQAGLTAQRGNLDAAMQQLGMGLQRDTSQAGLQLQGAQTRADLDRQVQELGARLGLDAGQFNVQQALQAALANQQAGLTSGQANQQTLLRALQGDQDAMLRAALANQQAGLTSGQANQQAMMEAQRLQDASRLGFSNLGLNQFQANEASRQAQEREFQNRMQQIFGGAQTLSGLGSDFQRNALAGANALQNMGTQQQQQQQASLDLAYQDFINQRDYERNAINFLSSVLRGVPVTPSATTSTFENPNPYSQLLGLGVSGVALNNMLRGGGG